MLRTNQRSRGLLCLTRVGDPTGNQQWIRIVLIVWLVGMWSVSDTVFAGDLVARYSGANNPESDGWSLVGTPGQQLLDDQGFDAYSIDVSDGVTSTRYEKVVDAGDQEWKLTTRVRVINTPDNPNDFGAIVQFYEHRKNVPAGNNSFVGHAYSLLFGSTASGDTKVSLAGSRFVAPTNFASAGFVEVPGLGYHVYELIFKRNSAPGLNFEGAGAASLYVDGISVYTFPYVGWDVDPDDDLVPKDSDQLLFGNYGTARGNMNVSYIDFEIGEDLQSDGIPEPATAGMVVLGAMAWLGFRRRPVFVRS